MKPVSIILGYSNLWKITKASIVLSFCGIFIGLCALFGVCLKKLGFFKNYEFVAHWNASIIFSVVHFVAFEIQVKLIQCFFGIWNFDFPNDCPSELLENSITPWLMIWIIITILAFIFINLAIFSRGQSPFTSFVFTMSFLMVIFQIIMIIAGAVLFFKSYDFTSNSSKTYLGCYKMWAISASICGFWIGIPCFYIILKLVSFFNSGGGCDSQEIHLVTKAAGFAVGFAFMA